MAMTKQSDIKDLIAERTFNHQDCIIWAGEKGTDGLPALFADGYGFINPTEFLSACQESSAIPEKECVEPMCVNPAHRSNVGLIDKKISEDSEPLREHLIWYGLIADDQPTLRFKGQDIDVRRYLFSRHIQRPLDYVTVYAACRMRYCVNVSHLKTQRLHGISANEIDDRSQLVRMERELTELKLIVSRIENKLDAALRGE